MEKISERLFLIAQNPKKKSSFVSGIYCANGLVGALLLEMADEQLILVKEKMLYINTKKSTDEPIYSEILSWINKSSKIRKLDYWVRFLAQKSKSLRNQVFKSLEDQRLIKIHLLKFLGIPYRKIELKAKLQRKGMIRDLKVKLQAPKDLSDLDFALLMLIYTCSLHRDFGKSRKEVRLLFKELKKEMDSVKNNNSGLDSSIIEIRKSILASIMVSTMTPVLAS